MVEKPIIIKDIIIVWRTGLWNLFASTQFIHKIFGQQNLHTWVGNFQACISYPAYMMNANTMWKSVYATLCVERWHFLYKLQMRMAVYTSQAKFLHISHILCQLLLWLHFSILPQKFIRSIRSIKQLPCMYALVKTNLSW